MVEKVTRPYLIPPGSPGTEISPETCNDRLAVPPSGVTVLSGNSSTIIQSLLSAINILYDEKTVDMLSQLALSNVLKRVSNKDLELFESVPIEVSEPPEK